MFTVRDLQGHLREFPDFAAADRYARGYVRANNGASGSLRIVLDHAIVAYVEMDGAGRVWTDMLDGTVA
jgi:hypothetical protein